MSTKIHPKRGLLVDKSVHEKSPKSVHEKSPFHNVHKKLSILKKSVHEMSLSTKCLHPSGIEIVNFVSLDSNSFFFQKKGDISHLINSRNLIAVKLNDYLL